VDFTTASGWLERLVRCHDYRASFEINMRDPNQSTARNAR
jgi:hypothetical protein